MSSRPDRHDFQARVDRWCPRVLAVWTVVGAFVAAWLVVGALSFVQQALELLLVGGVVGFVCSPITNCLEDAGVPRGAAAFLALLAFLVALVAVLALVGGPLLQELVVLLRNVPSYVTQVNQGLQDFWAKVGTSENSNVQNFVNSLVGAASTMGNSMASDLARQVSGGLAANLSALASDFTTFFLGIILAYWFAVDYPRMARELVRVVGPERGRDVTLILAVLSRSTGGYMRGTLITSIADGLMVAVGAVLVGHPYAGLVGALTFVMHFIPVIGPMLSAVVGTLLGLFVSPVCALWTLAIAMVAQNVADNLLSPMVMRSAVPDPPGALAGRHHRRRLPGWPRGHGHRRAGHGGPARLLRLLLRDPYRAPDRLRGRRPLLEPSLRRREGRPHPGAGRPGRRALLRGLSPVLLA